MPAIHHGMGEAYYKALVHLRSKTQLDKFLDILEATDDARAAADADFASIVTSFSAALGDEDEGEAQLGLEVVAAADMPRSFAEDLRAVHRIAASVLRGIRHEMVDIRSVMAVTAGGRKHLIRFDNCSHSTGKQRAYISCPCQHHRACFKFSIVEKHASPAHAAAWPGAWAAQALHQPAGFTKEAHKRFLPPAALVEELMQSVCEERP